MKTMQDFYTQLTSSSAEAGISDRRLPGLSKVNKAQLIAASSESVWYFWDAPQSIVVA